MPAPARAAGGKSLLPAGVVAVEGDVRARRLPPHPGSRRKEIARGITAYTSAETLAILGRPSSEIESRLGYSGPDELIHRDDLVLM